ncbi:hypothetical protein NDA12_001955 [Ustilago hordei]|nr:hypothetical protein NDA12_001955 [Ustilago hordei]
MLLLLSLQRVPSSSSTAQGPLLLGTPVPLVDTAPPPHDLLGTIDINVMMTPRSGVSVDDDEVDGVGDGIGDVDDNEVDGVGDKVGGVNTSVQCVDLMLEVIPGPQWTTAFGSIYIRTANLLWAPSDVR